ncbi:hypothetical protein FZI85_13980 [Mycobacterium sp. CBMA293]|uniref:hypothetical protein n=1 Tax=unclassified Mycolicibacterium TaxID=2636767 RepID=UPI0012DF1396|nr:MULTISPECIES: hypothetical protein [unclassified Mycolicibacterium]MUL49819.1 hypothetical protein [Mycolicibacterium sp. CBMA 360]MUL59640.1 hypothetical protein [Mycolicibacterium sp. CBMA 335]MUL71365.1 hypothetical protein [Mycolicibacterium sp. CBMA 311]MUL95008.1 hypothetical protein [Mycolicibacterium sp. CBMA 230]MUM12128.1 hypothetical protein [Mycolicibacterium sp. CBMA 293]
MVERVKRVSRGQLAKQMSQRFCGVGVDEGLWAQARQQAKIVQLLRECPVGSKGRTTHVIWNGQCNAVEEQQQRLDAVGSAAAPERLVEIRKLPKLYRFAPPVRWFRSRASLPDERRR